MLLLLLYQFYHTVNVADLCFLPCDKHMVSLIKDNKLARPYDPLSVSCGRFGASHGSYQDLLVCDKISLSFVIFF